MNELNGHRICDLRYLTWNDVCDVLRTFFFFFKKADFKVNFKEIWGEGSVCKVHATEA